MALTNKLTAIADAIREKGNTTELLTLDAMPAAIAALEVGGGGSGEGDEDIKLHWEGSLKDWNKNGKWDWYFLKYGNKITTDRVQDIDGSFNSCSLETIPFDFNFVGSSGASTYTMFQYCRYLKHIGDFVNLKFTNTGNMFSGCTLLRQLPNFINCSNGAISSSDRKSSMFANCYSLRSIPENLLKEVYSTKVTSSCFANMFENCYVLDEIVGLSPQSGTLTTNNFASAFTYCYRLKNIIFDTKEDGKPYIVNWKNQGIELYNGVGWLTQADNVLTTNYNSGITVDKKVTDETNYPTLKNDPDWFTGSAYYSRFNKTSALNLINSLPDASAYLATQSGGMNSIVFRQDAGKNTDGGQIGDITEEEIAVATAKGWTISYRV
jgi:hypothetical protein